MKKTITQIVLLALLLIQLGIYAKDNSNITSKPTNLDSHLQDIQWCGDSDENDQRAVLLTSRGTVYRSEDRGATWIKMFDSFNRAGINAKMDLDQNVGVVTEMIASPIDSSEIVFMGTDGINWITTDCGLTIQALGISLNLKEFMFHPKEKNWMLASSWSVCEKENEKNKKKKSENCAISKDLYLSENKGKTWKILLKYVVQFSWAHKVDSELTEVPSQRIIYSKETGNTGHQRIKGWNMKTHLYYTDDFVKSSSLIVNQGNKFLLTENYLFAAQVHNSETQVVKLMVATLNNKEYTFNYADIPEDIHQHSFTVLDTKEGQVFLNINHLGSKSPMGTTYNSDSTGTRYSLSIEDNVRGSDGQCDFEAVSGVEGIYISNVFAQTKKLKDVKSQLKQIDPDSSSNDIPSEKSRKKGNQKTQTTESIQDSITEIQEQIVSRISFDKGNIWQPLKAPVKDSSGKNLNCETSKKCSLHVHSVSSQLEYGPVYSSENSAGILIATGNTGPYLSRKSGKVNTYLSRDGGLGWEEIRKGSHIYEVADHGSIIVMANDQEPIKNIYYSWDEGKTWASKQITDTPFMVSNIITEPGNTSDKFLVYGSIDDEEDESITTGVIILVDFSSLHPRNCQGHDNPGTNDSDYEYWTPHNPNEYCLLGREVKYVRRKRDSPCFNTEKFERPVSVKKCECTERDWECDVGYKRSGSDPTGPCVIQEGYSADNNTSKVCLNYSYITQGYRKIAGNKCEGGVDHAPYKIPCPMFGFLSYNSLFYNVLILAAMVAIVYYIVQNKEPIISYLAQNNVDSYLYKILAFVQNSALLIYSTILPNRANQQQGYVQALQDEESKKGYGSISSDQKDLLEFNDDLIDRDDDDEETDAYKQQNNVTSAPQKKGSSNNKSPNTNNANSPLDDDDGFDPRK